MGRYSNPSIVARLQRILAAQFGVHRASLVRTLRAGGVDVRYRVLTDDDLVAACALYECGLSLAAVGHRLGVSARTVLNAFRRAGVPTRAVGANQWTR